MEAVNLGPRRERATLGTSGGIWGIKGNKSGRERRKEKNRATKRRGNCLCKMKTFLNMAAARALFIFLPS